MLVNMRDADDNPQPTPRRDDLDDMGSSEAKMVTAMVTTKVEHINNKKTQIMVEKRISKFRFLLLFCISFF